MKLPYLHSKKGFSLIELLIVIAIIGILVSIGLAAFSRAQTQARDGQRKADIEQIRGALEQYYADNNHYPATADLVGDLQGPAPALVYLKVVPTGYTYTSSGQNYCIEVTLEIAPPATPTPPTCDTLNYGLTAQD